MLIGHAWGGASGGDDQAPPDTSWCLWLAIRRYKLGRPGAVCCKINSAFKSDLTHTDPKTSMLMIVQEMESDRVADKVPSSSQILRQGS